MPSDIALRAAALERRRVRTMLAFLPAAIVMMLGGIIVWRLDALRDAQRWVDHTRTVLATNTALIGRLVDLETGYRGYVLTGNESFLDPYAGSDADSRRQVARLEALTRDNPAQQRRVAALREAVEAKIAWGDSIMATLRTRGRADATTLVATLRGKTLMDEVRRDADAVAAVEEQLLIERSAQADRQGSLILLLIVVGATLAGLAAGLTNLGYARIARREAHAAAELERQNELLGEQAGELEMQREQLQDQAAELEVQTEELQATTEELMTQAEALRSSEEQLRRAVEGAEIATWSWDLATDRVLYQSGLDRLFGLPGPHVSGREVFEAIHPDVRRGVEDAINRSLTTGDDYSAEFRLSDEAGGTRWLVGRGKALGAPSSDGRPARMVGVNFDVTERKRLEAERERLLAEATAARRRAEQSEARYRTVLDTANEGIWLLDDQGRITYANVRMAESLGTTPEAMVGHLAVDYAVAEDRPALTRQLEIVLAGGAEQFDIRLCHTDQSEIFALGSTSALRNAQGTVSGAIAMFSDVTERRRAERQLRQAQQLQAVGTLAGGVAHEINNQMTAVLGFGAFALKALGPEHPQAADIGEVLKAAGRAAKISQQLLTFSRRQVSQPRVLTAYDAVVALRPVLERILGADKSLAVTVDGSAPPVLADPTQIDQVLINLVANARDALGPGGRVSIGIVGVDLDPSYAAAHGDVDLVPGRFACISVGDNGRGMDRATVAKIFEPFFTTKPIGQGSGLGLSMVYGIVKQHGGFVWAYSEPELGTTIKVYLPGAAAAPHGHVSSDAFAGGETDSRASGARVLVVEDEPVVRALVVRSLQAAGYQTLEAGDGAEALAVVHREQGRPDLVLTDVVMPTMNGRELGEALARLHVRLPVLYMSGYAVDDVRQRGLVPVGAPFVQKPFSPDGLVDQVRLVLKGGA